MALAVLDRDTFLTTVRHVVERAAGWIDWAGLLSAYEWDGSDWLGGLAARGAMHERLVVARSDRQRADVVAEIVAWGRLPGLNVDAVSGVLRSLPLLDVMAESTQAPLADLYAKRVPAVSKVYAMYSPSRWVIYDSRVARGLALLTVRTSSGGVLPSALRFPQPPGRTGGRPEGFPALGSELQARLAFVYASWFAQQLASRISVGCPDPDGWDTRHVEMALFMLGSPSRSVDDYVSLGNVDAIVEAIDDRLIELSAERSRLEAARRALLE